MTANIGSSNTVESSTSDLSRCGGNKPLTKASEHRRITKPIMEKKRRARINNSLNELKVLILDALNKDPSRHSKLEKADILEMTVRHLQKLQRQQVAASIVNDGAVLNKYRAGFSECATEVSRYMGHMMESTGASTVETSSLRQRILSHLNHCVNSLNQMQNAAAAAAGVGAPFAKSVGGVPFPGNPLQVQIPFGTTGPASSSLFSSSSSAFGGDINNNSNSFLNANHHHHHQSCSSPVDIKSSSGNHHLLSTPPSSASSTTSSHFAFNLHPHSVHHLQSSPSSKNPISDLFFRGSKHHLSSSLSSPAGSSASSLYSEQLSPSACSELDMAVDCSMGGRHHNSTAINSKDDENVWRPW